MSAFLGCNQWLFELPLLSYQPEPVWKFASDRQYHQENFDSLDRFSFSGDSVIPRDGCVGKTQHICSFWHTQNSLSSTNKYTTFKVTSIICLPDSDAHFELYQIISLSCLHALMHWAGAKWLDDYIFARTSSWTDVANIADGGCTALSVCKWTYPRDRPNHLLQWPINTV